MYNINLIENKSIQEEAPCMVSEAYLGHSQESMTERFTKKKDVSSFKSMV